MEQRGIASFSGKVSHWRMVLRAIRSVQRMHRTAHSINQNHLVSAQTDQPKSPWRACF